MNSVEPDYDGMGKRLDLEEKALRIEKLRRELKAADMAEVHAYQRQQQLSKVAIATGYATGTVVGWIWRALKIALVLGAIFLVACIAVAGYLEYKRNKEGTFTQIYIPAATQVSPPTYPPAAEQTVGNSNFNLDKYIESLPKHVQSVPSRVEAPERPDCHYKSTMTDADYKTCGITPPN